MNHNNKPPTSNLPGGRCAVAASDPSPSPGGRCAVAASGTPSPKTPSRKHPVHMPIVNTFNRANIVFLTVCSKDKKAIFANSKVHDLLLNSWFKAQWWRVGRYVIMPDHIHMFCSPAVSPEKSIGSWMQYWKSLASQKWPCTEERPVWQLDGWDTQLRREDSYSAKWEYVRQNPVRAGLVGLSEDWPYQGEVNVLQW